MKMKTLAAALCLGLALTGCARLQPVNNINNTTPAALSEYKFSTHDVEQAIVRGVTLKGWTIEESTPGKIVARINVRGKHMAKVDIDYNQSGYSINYNDSNNLLFNGSAIHRNYNKWVVLLDRTIQSELVSLKDI